MIKKIILILLFLIAITYSFVYNQKVKLDDIYYNNGEYINIDSTYLKNKTHKNYVLFVHNSFCTFKTPCDTIFKQYMKKYKIDFLTINIDEYKKTKFYTQVKYAPTVIVVNNNRIVAYLDAEKDKDLDKYQDVNEFEKWINKYIETNN